MEKLTSALLSTYRAKTVTPVIVEAVPGRYEDVRASLRQIVPVGLLETQFHTFLPRIMGLIEIPVTKFKEIPTFNMMATALLPDLIEDIAQLKGVKMIYPDRFIWANSTVPSMGVYTDRKGKGFTSTHWTKRLLGLDAANDKGFAGNGITAAVLDTGARITHPMLHRVSPLTAIPEKGGSGEDGNGHGSWCNACVGGAQATDPRYNVPVEGMAPQCNLVSIQCLGFIIGMGTDSDIIKAMEMSIQRGAKVVSMSLGGDTAPKDSENPETKAINDMASKGIIPCVAAGNCLKANDWVLTKEGYKTAHNLWQIGPGLDLVNYNQVNGGFEFDPLIAVHKRPIRPGETILRIDTEEGHVIELTADHPVLTHSGWKTAGDLAVGDEIIVKPDTPSKYKMADLVGNTLMTGRKMSSRSSEHRKKLSESQKQLYTNGYHHPMKGKHWSPEIIKRMRRGRLGKGLRRVTNTCEFCGKQFETTYCRSRRFCTTACTHAWERGKHMSPDTEFKPGHLGKLYIPLDDLTRLGTEALLRFKREQLAASYEASLRGAITVRKRMAAERKTSSLQQTLEALLINLGISFESEYPVNLGWHRTTIIDIAIPDRNIAIYADGEYWHNLPCIPERDAQITQELTAMGWRVYRFKEAEIRTNLMKTRAQLLTAVTNGARVISIVPTSARFVYDFETQQNHTLIVNGLVLHNSGPKPSTVGTPGSCLNSLTVGAWDEISGGIAGFSSRGPTSGDGYVKPDVVAPGWQIDSALIGYLDAMVDPQQLRYGSISGTSMATPHVAGLVTCMAQLYKERVGKDLTVDEVKRMMTAIGPNQPKDSNLGWGLLAWPTVENWVSSQYGIKI